MLRSTISVSISFVRSFQSISDDQLRAADTRRRIPLVSNMLGIQTPFTDSSCSCFFRQFSLMHQRLLFVRVSVGRRLDEGPNSAVAGNEPNARTYFTQSTNCLSVLGCIATTSQRVICFVIESIVVFGSSNNLCSVIDIEYAMAADNPVK
jgi:hypothetical protein